MREKRQNLLTVNKNQTERTNSKSIFSGRKRPPKSDFFCSVPPHPVVGDWQGMAAPHCVYFMIKQRYEGVTTQ